LRGIQPRYDEILSSRGRGDCATLRNERDLMEALANGAPARERVQPAARGRLLALDLLRGLTIAFMILVNNNGGDHAWWPFKHADWNGFTPTDLVFPAFLFIVGISIVYSADSRLQRGETRTAILVHAAQRAAILCVLGIVVNSYPFFALDTMRFYGVLQRIGVCSLVVTALYLYAPGWRNGAGLAAAALLGYWVLMRFVPVPDYGIPGRDITLLDPDGNLAAWIDRQTFAAAHLYERTRDPEGLLSTLPSLATTLIGLLAGTWLRSDRTLARKVAGIAWAGLGCLLLGALWHVDFPINKKLWTSSYVLFAGGWSLLLLALFLVVVDLRDAGGDGRKRSTWQAALLVFGANSIVAYLFSELLAATLMAIRVDRDINLQQWLCDRLAAVIPNAVLAALAFSLGFVAVCWLFAAALYRRRIFIKI
jgi:predicted acyltransferase